MVEFLGTISKFRKRNKISLLLVYVLHKTRLIWYFQVVVVQCTKKRDARAKLLFCLLNLLFVDVLVALASLNLTVPIEIAPKSPFLCVPTEALSSIVFAQAQ